MFKRDDGEALTVGWIAIVDLLVLAVVIVLGYGQSVTIELKDLFSAHEALAGQYQVDLAELQRDIARLNGELDSHADARDREKARGDRLSVSLETAEAAKAGLEAEIQALLDRLAAFQDPLFEAAQMRIRLKDLEVEFEELRLAKADLEKENQENADRAALAKRLQERLAEEENSRAALESQLSDLATQLTAKANELTVALQKLRSSETELARRQAELQSATQLSERLRARIVQEQNDRDALEGKLTDLEKRLTAQTNEVTATLEKLRSSESELSRRRTELQSAMDRIGDLTRDNDSLREFVNRIQKFVGLPEGPGRIGEIIPLLERRDVGLRQELLGIKSRERKLRRVVFVVDQSGSMKNGSDEKGAGPGVDRWTDVKTVIETWIRLLPSEEMVLITFNNYVTRFPRSGTQPQGKASALIEELNRLQPQGQTNTLAALEAAYQVENADAIFLFTDGRPEAAGLKADVIQRQILELVERESERTAPLGTTVPINVIALGDYFGDEVPDVQKGNALETLTFGAFLQRIAQLSGGAFIGR